MVRFTHSAMERQVLESVVIQEEQRKSIILNSKAEYSRCALPRLTAKIGEEEYDEIRIEEKKQERALEETVKKDIARRTKENCKKRGKEIHEREEIGENSKQKRRKLDEDGKYKTVVQLTASKKTVERMNTDEEKSSKRRRINEKEIVDTQGEEKEEETDRETEREEEITENRDDKREIEKGTTIYNIQNTGTGDQGCSTGEADRLAEKEKRDIRED